VKIAKDCPLGPHLVRIYNDQGTGALRTFMVDRHPEVMEAEPNDSRAAAQLTEKLPVIINGQLERPVDDDCFEVNAEVGQWIIGEVICRRLGSPVDPALHLFDPDGVDVAFNHDTYGLDPLIAWQVKRAGRYVIEVAGFTYPPAADVRFTGAKAAVYRLLLTHGPYARSAFPTAVKRGETNSVHLFGWNLGESGNSIVADLDASGLAARSDFAWFAPSAIHNSIRVAADDLPQILEREPNDRADLAQAIVAPCAVNGRISHAGDARYFRLTAKKSERLVIAIQSAALDFPLDPVLSIADSSGKQLLSADDTGPLQDPKVEWAAPADGQYLIQVADRYGKGGRECVYRLTVRPALPDFTATVDASAFVVQPGKSAEMTVTIARQNGHALPLAVVLDKLPPGVSAPAGQVPPGGGAVKISISAAPNAAPANVPIRAMIVSLDPDHPIARPAIFSIGADQLIPNTDSLWLTIPPVPPTSMPAQ
jgi:hypothetical protein